MRFRGLLLLVPLSWIACFSQSSGGGGNAQFDAGFDAEFDSTSPDAEPVEGSVAEAAADAAPIVDASVDHVVEAGPLPVTVVVAGAQGYEPGVNVVFGDSTGAVVATAVTDAGGEASTVLPTVTMATVVLGTTANPSLYTAIGLSPGSLVPVVDTASVVSLQTHGAQVTTLPTTPALGNVSQYDLTSGACRSYYQAPPFSLSLQSSLSTAPCVGLAKTATSIGAVVPAIVDAVDPNGVVLGFAAATPPSPATPDDAGQLDIGLPSVWSTTTTDQLVGVTNPPDGGGLPTVVYSEVVDGILAPLQANAVPADAGAGAMQLVHTHVGFAPSVQAEAMWTSYPAAGGNQSTSLVTTAPAPAQGQSGTLNLDATALATAPSFATAITAAGPSPAQPLVQWTLASGDLGGAAGVLANLSWTGSFEGGMQNGTWTIVSPGTTGTSIATPALPASLAAYAPSNAIWTMNEIFAVVGPAAVPGYAAMLSIGSLIVVQPCSIYAPAAPPLPGLGNAIVVGFAPGSQC